MAKEDLEKKLFELKIKLENNVKLSREEKKILKDNDKEAQEKKKKMSFGERLKLASKSEYAQLQGEGEIDNYAIRDWISTGNWLFNAQISGDPFKGCPSGRIMQLAGINSCGKTFLMLETIKSAQDLGYFAVILDSEFANNDKTELKKRGINLENCLFIPVDTVESLSTTVINLLDEIGVNEKVIIGIDSIGNLSTNKEITDIAEGSETADMTRAKKLRAFFRTCTLKAGVKNVPIIPINHTYSQIGGFGGRVVGGGEGSLYNSSIIAEFTKAQEKNSDKTETVGALITSTATKCRTAKEKTKVKFSINFEEGLTLESGLLEYCLDEKLLLKVKQSYIYNKAFMGKEPFFNETEYSKGKMTQAWWKTFLDNYLAEYLRQQFKYQSSTEGITVEEDEEEI
jgi:RecA/RadA recombinase